MQRSVLHGGFLLRCARKHVGLTQEELCQLAGINGRTYQNWESKTTEPDFSMVCSICADTLKLSIFEAWQIAEATL